MRMVFDFSRQAVDLADAMDNQSVYFGEQQVCPRCRRPGLQVTNAACGHAACPTCWLQWCAARAEDCVRMARLAIPCCHKGCGAEAGIRFWSAMAAWESAGKKLPLLEQRELLERARVLTDHCAAARHQAERLDAFGAPRRVGALEPGPICPVCREHCVSLLSDRDSAGCALHTACEGCWTLWAQERLERCRLERRVAVPCLGGCGEDVSQRLWRFVAARRTDLGALERDLVRRERLTRNRLYPTPMQVNCPQPGCVGLGYLGFDTVMCFVCEHVWLPEGDGGLAPTTDVEVVMGVAVKRCPRCTEYIEKNGGCDHMTCRCKYEFRWSTLEPYNPSAS